MNLDDFIITCFCWIDDMLPEITKGKRLRQRGPEPKLSDSEILTMEVVGVYLGVAQDEALFAYFCHHYAHSFPQMANVHRTTWVRQAANLWAGKERLWCHLREHCIQRDLQSGIIDSMPMPVSRFARASWCVRFRGIARFGKDHAERQPLYGFRLHLLVSWTGVIMQAFLASANEADGEIAPVLLEEFQGVALEDRNYWLPDVQTSLRNQGILLLAPFRKAHSPKAAAYQSSVLGCIRYLVDTVFEQLTDRFRLKRVWVRDLWHLRTRLLRSILTHTLCFWLNQQADAPCLQFDHLVA